MTSPKTGPTGWDVGERPTVRMAYLEYPRYAPPETPICRRDDEEMQLKKPFERPSESVEEQARVAARNTSGWAADKVKSYKPLGKLEDALKEIE